MACCLPAAVSVLPSLPALRCCGSVRGTAAALGQVAVSCLESPARKDPLPPQLQECKATKK